VTTARSAYVAKVVRLYLDDPDTPIVPSSADWDIAGTLFDSQVPLESVKLAIKLAFVRRHSRISDVPLPPIRSLSYFRTVALSLTDEEAEPAYVDYVDQLFEHLRALPSPDSNQTSTTDRTHDLGKNAP
jgi:hypothetical protein